MPSSILYSVWVCRWVNTGGLASGRRLGFPQGRLKVITKRPGLQGSKGWIAGQFSRRPGPDRDGRFRAGRQGRPIGKGAAGTNPGGFVRRPGMAAAGGLAAAGRG